MIRMSYRLVLPGGMLLALKLQAEALALRDGISLASSLSVDNLELIQACRKKNGKFQEGKSGKFWKIFGSTSRLLVIVVLPGQRGKEMVWLIKLLR